MVVQEKLEKEALLREVEVIRVLIYAQIRETVLGERRLDLLRRKQVLDQLHIQHFNVVEVGVLQEAL